MNSLFCFPCVCTASVLSIKLYLNPQAVLIFTPLILFPIPLEICGAQLVVGGLNHIKYIHLMFQTYHLHVMNSHYFYVWPRRTIKLKCKLLIKRVSHWWTPFIIWFNGQMTKKPVPNSCKSHIYCLMNPLSLMTFSLNNFTSSIVRKIVPFGNSYSTLTKIWSEKRCETTYQRWFSRAVIKTTVIAIRSAGPFPSLEYMDGKIYYQSYLLVEQLLVLTPLENVAAT